VPEEGLELELDAEPEVGLGAEGSQPEMIGGMRLESIMLGDTG
jgi:hypothetical protein